MTRGVFRRKLAAGGSLRTTALMLSILLGSTVVIVDSRVIHAQSKPSPQVLPPIGERVERDIEAGQTHVYTLEVPAAHFADIQINQLGVDVAVDILDPAGTKLFTADSPSGPSGIESAAFAAGAAGRHTLEVKVFDCTSSPRGKYTVEVKALRPASDRDRSVAEATRTEADALAEWNKFTDEGLETALAKYTQAREMWTRIGEPTHAAGSLHKVGGVLLAKGDLQGAFNSWKEELKIREGLGDKLLQAEILNSLGFLLHDAGNAKESIGFFEKALPLGEGDFSLQGGSLRGLAQAYSSLGDKKKALATVEQALEVLAKSDDRVEEAKAQDFAGDLYRERGRLGEALVQLQKALAVWSGNCEELASYATTLANIAAVYSDTGDRQQAVEYYQQALDKSREADDPNAQFVALNGIGVLYEKLGRKDEAVLMLTEALTLAEESRNRSDIGTALVNIGRAYQPFRNLTDMQARSAAKRALGFYMRGATAYRDGDDAFGQCASLYLVAQIQFQYFSPVLALTQARRTLRLAVRTGNSQVQIQALNLIGRIALRTGRWREAARVFEKALVLARESGFRGDETESLFGLAQVQSGRGAFEEARRRLDEALVIVEDLRYRLTDRELRTSFFSSRQDYYEFYVDLLMRMHRAHPAGGYNRTALEMSERARARAFVDWLQESGASAAEGIPLETRTERTRLLREIDGRIAGLTQALSDEADPEQLRQFRSELDALVGNLKAVDDQIRVSNPRYADLFSPEPVSVPGIQADVSDAETVLIEYFVGKDKSFVWVVTSNEVISRELPGKETIERMASDFHEAVSVAAKKKTALGATTKGRSNTSINDRKSLTLSKMILGPVSSALSARRLVIAGHGALQYIPFAALPDPRPGASKLLVEEHEIVSIPSASAVLADKKNAHRRAQTTGELIVFADPIFSKDDARLTAVKPAPEGGGDDASRKVVLDDGVEQAAQDTGVLKPGLRLKRLPGTRREADEIRKAVSQEAGRGLYDFDANRDIAMSGALANYRVVHFATHGLLNAKNPENSGLVLSRFDEKGAPRDGFLRARDVLNMRLNADLVVLSACETGLGKDVRGEGLVGLSRAFLYAGAPRIVVSLWAVNDAATAELMARFYRKYYTEKMAPAAALRAAQIELIQETEWKEPCYWAAFVVQGAWE